MAEDLVVLEQWDAVLVVVAAVGHEVAQADCQAGRLQEALLSGFPVELDQTHVVGRADGGLHLPGPLRLLVKRFQVTGGPDRDLEQGPFPGQAVVRAGGREQVAEIIGFEVVDIPLAADAAVLPFPDDLLGRQVAVRLLGLPDQLDESVDPGLEGRILAFVGDQHGAFQDFVEVPVVKRRAFVMAVPEVGGDLEIGHGMEVVVAFEKAEYMGDHRVRDAGGALLPETVAPCERGAGQ